MRAPAAARPAAPATGPSAARARQCHPSPRARHPSQRGVPRCAPPPCPCSARPAACGTHVRAASPGRS
eukprot:6884255-Prymnesium_polylepis.1